MRAHPPIASPAQEASAHEPTCSSHVLPSSEDPLSRAAWLTAAQGSGRHIKELSDGVALQIGGWELAVSRKGDPLLPAEARNGSSWPICRAHLEGW